MVEFWLRLRKRQVNYLFRSAGTKFPVQDFSPFRVTHYNTPRFSKRIGECIEECLFIL